MVILEVHTSGEEADAHDDSAEESQEFFPFGTILPVNHITQVAANRTHNKVEKPAILKFSQLASLHHKRDPQNRGIITSPVLVKPAEFLAEKIEQDVFHLCIERQFLKNISLWS
jgi:hypothetical protein